MEGGVEGWGERERERGISPRTFVVCQNLPPLLSNFLLMFPADVTVNSAYVIGWMVASMFFVFLSFKQQCLTLAVLHCHQPYCES